MFDDIPRDYLFIPAGATFTYSWYADDAITGAPADWTGYSGRMQIRDDDGTLIATLATSGTRNGDVVLSDAGNITIRLADEFTATMPPITGGVFDLELTDATGATWRVVQGRVKVTAEVTTS